MTPTLTFLSAFLLFLVEPLISKWILPWYGGVASVWTTCLLFFQTVLLLGYGWAYLLSKFCRPRTQLILHLLALAAALYTLPIVPQATLRPLGTEDPIVHLLWVLMRTLGAPFFILSATAPLLQSWRHTFRSEKSPYWLYALSNLGSFLGLLSYPFLVEPSLYLSSQSILWSWGFAIFSAMIVIQAIQYYRQTDTTAKAALPSTAEIAEARPCGRIIFEWFLLSVCSSWLLLATTNHLCRDVASIPLLWVIPLALFLLSYVVTFARRPLYKRKIVIILYFVALSLMTLLHLQGGSLQLLIITALSALFFGCLLCNGELVACKPAARYLSLFYFVTALGGAVGALFVSVIAPHIFSDYTEYALGFQFCALLVLLRLLESDKVFSRGLLTRSMATISLLLLACGGTALSLRMGSDNTDLISRRSFFGVTRVRESTDRQGHRRRELFHGTIRHGIQFIDDPMRPTTYYAPTSGVGRVFRSFNHNQGRDIAIIGLGSGTLAAYGQAGDRITFWDINPDIIDVAQANFSFLSMTPASVKVVYGDGRLGMERLSAQALYDIIIIDAFNGDSIPVHLVTHEALELYLSHLTSSGVIVFHISNLYLDLKPVLARAAERLHLEGRYTESSGDAAQGSMENEYVILSRSEAIFQHPLLAEASQPLIAQPDFRLWTDDYASLWSIVK